MIDSNIVAICDKNNIGQKFYNKNIFFTFHIKNLNVEMIHLLSQLYLN